MANNLPHAINRGSGPTEGESVALFPWWSITKSVLAAAALRLAEQGLISLDDFYNGRPYTIRQLLQHKAGLNNYGGEPYRAAVAAGDPVWPVAELLARVKAEQLIFTPGSDWAYSNVGYIFVRRLIEEKAGLGIDDALRMLVFGPMDIRRTRIATTPEDMKQTFWGNPMATIQIGSITACLSDLRPMLWTFSVVCFPKPFFPRAPDQR
jgi:CubicO group peptidase (beta-lactamase class C family)